MKFYGNDRKKKTKPARGRRPLVIVLVAVFVIIIAGIIFVNRFLKPPEHDPGFVNRNPTVTKNPDSDEPDDFDGVPLTIDGNNRRPGVYTFLIVGMDHGYEGINTDTILLGMIDTNNKDVNVASIPRDTLVNVPWKMKKMNTYYAHTREPDINELIKGIYDLAGIPVDCYAVVDFEAFVALVEAIGGVDFDIPYRMEYYDPDDLTLDINFYPGMQRLNGEQALQVVRFRGKGTDTQRIELQQEFLKTLAKKMLTPASLFRIGDYARIFEEYVDTNLDYSQIFWFMREALRLDPDEIDFLTLPRTLDVWIQDFSYVTVIVDEWVEMINKHLNPFTYEIKAEDLNILTLNPDVPFVYGDDWEIRVSYPHQLITTRGEFKGDMSEFSDGRFTFDEEDKYDPIPNS